jgi:hypothetical protein
MKKIISNITILFFFILISFVILLSTTGIKTNQFNDFISNKIINANKNVDLKFFEINFKLDIKELSLFIETVKPILKYKETVIPIDNVKAYMDFISIIKSKPKIKKINFSFNQLNINKLKKLSANIKPSNFKSFVNNKIKQGILNLEFEAYLNENYLLKNFIARGSVSNFEAEILNNIIFQNVRFNFIADKTDVLIKNIFGKTESINISEGDLKLTLSPEISLTSNFKSNIKYNSQSINRINLIKKLKYSENINDLEADIENNFSINFDKTYKVKNYNYKSNGKILKANLVFKKLIENNFLEDKIKQLKLINSEIKLNFNLNKKETIIAGKYSFNEGNPLSYNLENILVGELMKLKLDVDYDRPINLEFINYKKSKNKVANLFLNLEKKNEYFKIKKLNLIENNNYIKIKDLNFKKDKLLLLKKVSIKTTKKGIKNNDFSINFGKKIKVNGTQFDASFLPKIINQNSSSEWFSKVSKDIEIDFQNIIAPMSENLKNFKLIGKIENGKFTKINSKGDFGNNNYLDITMKKDKKNKKKYLEIYSDLTKPLLTEYSFFKGLTGGNLLFSSIIDGNIITSKLKIENFNVINAPGMVKLLSLADLSGLADLAEGDGLSFDILEINMEKNKNTLKLNEIIALGPSISVLMDGYQDSKVTSLRGTLVPAKTLNKMISKIPLLGKIIIPKEVGEGLFGISFKMKGPPGKIKTTINPIRTITPRFIQKIIDKNKKSK